MPPLCSDHNIDMVLRHRRRDGRPFYGCPRYPDCRIVVNVDSTGDADNSATTNATVAFDDPSGRFTPGEILASPIREKDVTEFFQACGVPEEIVYQCHYAEIERRLIRGFTQWRLDYPQPKNQESGSELDTILTVAESILLRGSLTFCSPKTEALQKKRLAKTLDAAHIKEALEAIISNPSCTPGYDRFRSDEERIFWNKATKWIEKKQLGWQILPEVHLSSITQGTAKQSGQSCDFLFNNPLTDAPAFVVEIDGKQHCEHVARDTDRDKALSNASVECRRIWASEISAKKSIELDQFFESLGNGGTAEKTVNNPLTVALRTTKFIHQLQVTILQIIKRGFVERKGITDIGVVLPKALATKKTSVGTIKAAETDIRELLEQLRSLYAYDIDIPDVRLSEIDGKRDTFKMIICPSNQREAISTKFPNATLFGISDISFPGDIAAPLGSATPCYIDAPNKQNAEWFFNYVFRKPTFWDGQWEAIERSLMGKDSVILLPTGGGKSMTFQLSAMLLPGRCLVIAPLISLMDDQVDNLKKVGIDRCVGISSQIKTLAERALTLKSFVAGSYLYSYISPERLQISEFRKALNDLTVSVPINVVAIDEAHCVSEWGHDFRTSYLNVGRNAREYCKSQSSIPPLMALTGTASKMVLKDVQRELGIKEFDATITPNSFDRPELRFHILRSKSDEKNSKITGFIRSLPSLFNLPSGTFFQPAGTQSRNGIIFCPHVNGDYGITTVANVLSGKLNVSVGIYSGGAPRNMDRDWDARKQKEARAFKRNQTQLLIATKAFGMGIDMPNVRYTVHHGLPPSIEAFYQEAGRAGRDGERAECLVILSDDLQEQSTGLLNLSMNVAEVANQIDSLSWGEGDDITRNLFFHTNAFKGELQDIEDLKEVINRIKEIGGDLTSRGGAKNITPPDSFPARNDFERQAARSRTEKAIHRLLVIGVVDDYTVNHSASEFSIIMSGASKNKIAEMYSNYAAAYQSAYGQRAWNECQKIMGLEHDQFVVKVAELIIGFVYQHVELSRRSQLNEMLQAVRSSKDDDQLRKRILDYLQQSEYDSRLNEVISSQVGGLDSIRPIISEIVSPKEAEIIRGGVARLLGSYPDNPGLLLLRCMSEILSRDADMTVATQSLESAIEFASGSYGLPQKEINDALLQMIQEAARRPEAANKLAKIISEWEGVDRELLRGIVTSISPNLALQTGWKLLSLLAKQSRDMRQHKGVKS